MREVVAVKDMARRLPQAGRIRIGVRAAKGNPRALTTFRFTSPDEMAIREIAEIYGGDAHSWAGSPNPGEWEVITERDIIRVALPPDPLGGTPIYELWSGGGCVRRCDGETAQVNQPGPEGGELVEVDCLCQAEDALKCRPTTRLTVILPDIRFGGGWRLESHGWNVAHEMPGMVELVERLQPTGMINAELALEPRSAKRGGQTKRFVVPVLRPGTTIDAIVAGDGVLGALGPGSGRPTQQELPPSTVSGMAAALSEDLDDKIVDAELIEDEEPDEAKRRAMFARLRDLGMGDDERHGLVMAATQGRSQSSNDLTAEELDRVLTALRAIASGEAVYAGLAEDGRAMVRKA